jgi:hypothetical protein
MEAQINAGLSTSSQPANQPACIKRLRDGGRQMQQETSSESKEQLVNDFYVTYCRTVDSDGKKGSVYPQPATLKLVFPGM